MKLLEEISFLADLFWAEVKRRIIGFMKSYDLDQLTNEVPLYEFYKDMLKENILGDISKKGNCGNYRSRKKY